MVLLGAKGSTVAQMVQALGLSSVEDPHGGFQSLLPQVHRPGAPYSLSIVYRLFSEESCEFLPSFQESCLLFYQAELEPLSFAKAPERSRNHINAWVSRKTEGKISELLAKNSTDEESRLVLINAVYFKGKGGKQVDKSCTRKMPFKVNQVEKSLTSEKLQTWTSPEQMERTKVEVFLRRFKLQEEYDMGALLQALRVVDAFQPGKADLSGTVVDSELCLSKFLHRSVVEVNVEGMEAAAARAVMVIPGCCLKSLPVFCADHPFLFFIRHNATHSLLFCGRFTSP
ncbi:serpin B9-like [Cavia porcellus]|uniref:serpin B9-like n=1 Tax=Cavia porcellus TaxID=10141 RepID=UPI002FE137FC